MFLPLILSSRTNGQKRRSSVSLPCCPIRRSPRLPPRSCLPPCPASASPPCPGRTHRRRGTSRTHVPRPLHLPHQTVQPVHSPRRRLLPRRPTCGGARRRSRSLVACSPRSCVVPRSAPTRSLSPH